MAGTLYKNRGTQMSSELENCEIVRVLVMDGRVCVLMLNAGVIIFWQLFW